MKHTLYLFIASLLFACANPKTALVIQIEDLSTTMKTEDFPSSKNIENILILYDQYIMEYPEDKATLDYMELKAKYLAANRDYQGAVVAYDDIIANFPEGDRKGDALFMQAFIYQNNLADAESSGSKYQAFIDQYPNHEMVDDARFALENLSLSDEEIYNKIIQLQSDRL